MHRVRRLKLARGEHVPPDGGHLQGAALYGDGCIVSASSHSVPYLVYASFASSRVTRLQVLPGRGLNHAGGIQICDDVLAVGVEDAFGRKVSEVQLWDLVSGEWLERLTLHRGGRPDTRPGDQTAGAVGLAQHAGASWLVVGNWDSAALDFHVCPRPLRDPAARFEPRGRFGARDAGLDWRSYQSLQLFSVAGALELVGMTDAYADRFRVRDGAPPELEPLGSSEIPLEQTSFRWAAGASRDERGLGFVATQKHLEQTTVLELCGP